MWRQENAPTLWVVKTIHPNWKMLQKFLKKIKNKQKKMKNRVTM